MYPSYERDIRAIQSIFDDAGMSVTPAQAALYAVHFLGTMIHDDPLGEIASEVGVMRDSIEDAVEDDLWCDDERVILFAQYVTLKEWSEKRSDQFKHQQHANNLVNGKLATWYLPGARKSNGGAGVWLVPENAEPLKRVRPSAL